jgi:hypothetical protein
MKKLFILFILFVLQSCVSIQKYNAQIYDPISVDALHSDIDYIYKKIKNHHPKLYTYISQSELDYKFDSLKKSIHEPMNSYDFNRQLSPVLSSIRQGHISSIPRTKKLNKKELKQLQAKGKSPLGQFDTDVFNNNMYIVENNTSQNAIKIGTQIIAINDSNISESLALTKNLFSSDGFNQTFYPHKIDRVFLSDYSYKYGILDSVKYELKWQDSVFQTVIYRGNKGVSKTTPTHKKLSKTQKDSLKKENLLKSINGYDPLKKMNNRSLNFQDLDSSIAILSIKSFDIGDFKTFYNQTFKLLKEKNTTHLIIDLRNNGGGRLSEITNLYSYLTRDSTYYMIDKQIVSKKTSMLHFPYFGGENKLLKYLRAPLAPFYYSALFIKTKKDSTDQYYFSTKYSKSFERNVDAFDGKIFVLINGGSFSASSILSSNLKGTKRAYFVGEETGGTYNGTVAGIMPFFTLPHSKVKVRFGLQLIAPTQKTEELGRGIFPDYEIIPTLNDRINGLDPEMNWILETIKKEKN